MSSMRNAIPKRSHRERAQPHSRTRKGLLEKRKDYVLRSQDYKRKQATIKRLSEKAAEKNPDEFYFGMISHRTKSGVPVADRPGSESLGIKEIKPLKRQDVAYLRTVRSIERRRIEKLRGVVPGSPSGNKKILFAENEAEAQELRENKKEQVEFGGRGMSKDAREMNARIAKDTELNKMERKAVLQVQLMGKGSARRIRRKDEDSDDEDTIPVYKWKPQRQK